MTQPFWTPSEEDIRQAGLTNFRKFANSQYGLKLNDYRDLHRWSTGTPGEMDEFWTALWDWAGIIGDKGPAPLFDARGPITETKGFLAKATLNWAENMLLSHTFARSKTQLALINLIEPDPALPKSDRIASTFLRSFTWDELYIEVANLARGLKKLGVVVGDRVVAMTPNNAEAVMMVLAVSSIGAIWSSVAPEFGAASVLERFVQLKPKVLLSTDKYRSSGKDIDVIPKLTEVMERLYQVGLEHVIIVGQLNKNRRPKGALPELDGVNVLAYPDLLDVSAVEIDFWRGPSNAPLWVLFSSGTTGKPKAIMHGQLAMLFNYMQSSLLHGNMKAGDRHMQITTTGWMMWNAMVCHLCCGITIVCYDGNPLASDRTLMFDFVDTHKVTSFSLSPRYLQILVQNGDRPNRSHSLQTLSTVFSAGSPLKPELYTWIYENIAPVYINNSSGGTDICGGFVGGNPILPIYAGVLQSPMLGAAVEAWDDNGNRVEQGEGDLVVTKPYALMPLGFMGDDANQTRFKDAYFNHYPKKAVWYHADHILVDGYGGINILGRSDGVLNPQGVRFGSAEIYAIVEDMKDEIDDCIAVGQRTPDRDERVILFVKTLSGKPLSAALVDRLRTAIQSRLSKRHVPAKIIQCPDIPYTINAKRVEVAVKKVVNGAPPSSLNTRQVKHVPVHERFDLIDLNCLSGFSGMANPQSLQFFSNMPELRFEAEPRAKL